LAKYRTRTLLADAFQWDGSDIPGFTVVQAEGDERRMIVQAFDGERSIGIGDWVAGYGTALTTYSDEDFNRRYELAEEVDIAPKYIKKLAIEPGSIVLVKQAGNITTEQINQFADDIVKYLGFSAMVVVVNNLSDVKALDDGQMARYGWVRRHGRREPGDQ
jgi:hypothetical protein